MKKTLNEVSLFEETSQVLKNVQNKSLDVIDAWKQVLMWEKMESTRENAPNLKHPLSIFRLQLLLTLYSSLDNSFIVFLLRILIKTTRNIKISLKHYFQFGGGGSAPPNRENPSKINDKLLNLGPPPNEPLHRSSGANLSQSTLTLILFG